VSISGVSGGTEGDSVRFVFTAVPSPAADLPVSVTVSVVGDFGVSAGSRTVTVPASGSATLTIATTDDEADESDGSITATLAGGSGYTIGSLNTRTAAVADDDEPPVPDPVVSISGGASVAEGGSASFTVSADPPPSADLDVVVTVSQRGDFGVAAGRRTVRIASGSSTATFTVDTTDDETDEPDGAVTVTLVDGSDYDLGTSRTATATVSDNDDPPVVVERDQPDDTPLDACSGRPALLISDPAASRSDASVDFEVSLSCIPSSNPTIMLTPVRDGWIDGHVFVALTSREPSATVTVTIGSEDQLGLALAWQRGLANSQAQGDVVYSD